MKKKEIYTNKEWAALASLFSEEKSEKTDLIKRFMSEDSHNTENRWKELSDMRSDDKIDVDKAWNSVYSNLDVNEDETKSNPAGIIFWRRSILKIAAVALLLISVGTAAVYMYNSDFFSKTITIATNSDQKNLQIKLPDGSKISLNRNTELSYKSNYGKKDRDVTLIGEAFFEIASDASKPFIIDAGSAKVKVIGTSFNVITKNSDSALEVYVETGKVIISGKSGSQLLSLEPGFIGKMDEDFSDKSLNNDPNYMSWNTGLLVYNGQKLDVVLNDLKRVYNMVIVADDPLILENRWTSPINNQSQETIIRLICTSFNLNYTKDGNVYHLAIKR